MSINSALSVARSALFAQQIALETAGHNIANAETEGYSRQILQLTPSAPFHTPFGNYGTGVTVQTIIRGRDALLDQGVRDQAAPASGFSTRSTLLNRIEDVFGEPSDTGLATTMDEFWNAWSDLAANPSSSGAKTVVQQRALALTDKFNSIANQLTAIEGETRNTIDDTLTQVNQLTSQIASINKAIVPAESGGHTANDLRDQRDRLIDQLSGLVPVTVIDRPDGSNQVNLGGIPLIDGPDSRTLVANSGPPTRIFFQGSPTPALTTGGKLGALVNVVNNDIGSAISSLDTLAQALITDVNAIHTTGWSPPSGAAGNWNPLTPPTGSGVLFFDTAPTNANARNFRLSSAIAANANAIASSDQLNQTGNNNIALAMNALQQVSPSAPSNSFGDAYRSLITTLASSASAASDSATVSQTLVDQASSRRAEVSGVSTDEELLQLMKAQQAYSAAAKVIQVIDEMSETLLSLKR